MSNTQILLVEDESIVAMDVQNRLKGMGYGVSAVASSGEEALRKAEETSPDLVLMDIVLKGNMDGIEASEHLRQRFDVPIVFLTAYADDSTLRRAKVTEPFGYLLKPYEERELYTTIEVALYRHRMERKLKETQQWLATTVQAIGDAVIATDAQADVRLMNPAAEGLTGWSSKEAIGKDLTEIFNLTNEQAFDLPENHLTKALREGTVVQLPSFSLLICRDGREVPIEGTVSPINLEGCFIGFVLAFRDISERKRAEEAQREIEEQRHQAHKMEAIGKLAGGVAHDFNNLLTVILGNTSLSLASLSQDNANRSALENVEKAALQAAELVKKLLGFSRQSILRPEILDLNQFIPKALEKFPLIDPRIGIEFRPAPNLWMVQADGAQLHQVLVNLCGNAQDAMPGGGRISLDTANVAVGEDHVSAAPQASPGEYVCLRVRDTGRGIASEIRARIFEPFFTTKELGKGLGLALVYGIVEQHHGWIECHCDVEPGTRFDIYLPRYYQETDVSPLPVQADLVPKARVRPPGPETILLADDEPMIRDLGRMILEKRGYQVLLAEDGVHAVETYQRAQDQIDLVILDLTMPKLSGSDAFWKLLVINPEIRVLFSSGYFADDVPTAEHDHVLGFLSKPYQVEEMVHAVHTALEKVKAARG